MKGIGIPWVYPDSNPKPPGRPKPTINPELDLKELAMDLKMHLEIVAPFVKMAKKSSICTCQLHGTAATRRAKGKPKKLEKWKFFEKSKHSGVATCQ